MTLDKICDEIKKIPIELHFNKNSITTNYKLVAQLYVDGFEECVDDIIYNVSDIQVP